MLPRPRVALLHAGGDDVLVEADGPLEESGCRMESKSKLNSLTAGLLAPLRLLRLLLLLLPCKPPAVAAPLAAFCMPTPAL